MSIPQVIGIAVTLIAALAYRTGWLGPLESGLTATVGVGTFLDVAKHIPRLFGRTAAVVASTDPFRDQLNRMVDIAEALNPDNKGRAIEQAAVIKNLIDDRYGVDAP